jgi:hypothetical protein
MQKNTQGVTTVFLISGAFEERLRLILSQKAVSNPKDSCAARHLVRVLGKTV